MLPSSPLSPALAFFLRVKKTTIPEPPLPLRTARGWGSQCDGGAGRGDSAPRAGVAELGNPMARKGRDSLVFVALVRFLGQPQAGQFRSTPKRANLVPGTKAHKPFLCNSPVI